MAKFNPNQKKQLNELVVEAFEIQRLHLWDNGGVTFDLTINNALTVYNCRLAANKEGEAYVSWPSRKGSDGKFYSHVYMRLSDKDQDRICQAVIDQMNA